MTTESRQYVSAPSLLAVIVLSGFLLAACGKSAPPSSAAVQAASSKPGSSQPFTVAGVFPPGEGRDLVLNTCGSCHPVVCTARGQHTAERWDNIQKDHKDKLTNVTGAQLNAMFSYLKENFNDKKPEPQVPAEFLQQGCTPF